MSNLALVLVPTPSWILPAHVHAAQVENDLVFLDIAADSYLCLPGAASRVRLAQDLRCVSIEEPDLAVELQRAGLLRPKGTEAPKPRPTAPTARRSALRYDHGLPRLADLSEVLGASSHLAVRYRGRRFEEIVAHRTPARRRARGSIAETVDRFHRWLPYAPVSGKCLLRSFMLRRLLDRAGHAHLWVFGVSTWPFRAHCWLQADDLVLDDTCENVRAYQPIMVA